MWSWSRTLPSPWLMGYPPRALSASLAEKADGMLLIAIINCDNIHVQPESYSLPKETQKTWIRSLGQEDRPGGGSGKPLLCS